jgi:hypothetical protein
MDFDIELSVSRPMKRSAHDTVEYESDMLRFAWNEVNMAAADTVMGQPQWMRVECFLLHYRSLIQLLDRKGQRSDDLSLATFDNEMSEEARDEIERVAGPLRAKYSTLISKYLAHGTVLRYTTDIAWRINEMYEALLPAIKKLREALCLPPWQDERQGPNLSASREAHG